MSNNGEQLFELCNKYNLKVMNASEHCEGVFTCIHKYKQTIEKSGLDYVFISSDLEEYFTSMQIDEEKHFTPWRSLKHGKRYSDHCAILSDMWQVGHHTEISYQKWQNNLNGLLHLCFKKKRIRCTKGIYNKQIRQLIKDRKQLERQITNSFLKHKKLMKKGCVQNEDLRPKT